MAQEPTGGETQRGSTPIEAELRAEVESLRAKLAIVAWDRAEGLPPVPVLQPRYDTLKAERDQLRQQLAQTREALREIRTTSSNEIYVGGIVPLGSANLKLDTIRGIIAKALAQKEE